MRNNEIVKDAAVQELDLSFHQIAEALKKKDQV